MLLPGSLHHRFRFDEYAFNVLVRISISFFFLVAASATKGFLPLILETSHENAHPQQKIASLQAGDRKIQLSAGSASKDAVNSSMNLRTVFGLRPVERKPSVVDLYASSKLEVIISASSKLR